MTLRTQLEQIHRDVYREAEESLVSDDEAAAWRLFMIAGDVSEALRAIPELLDPHLMEQR